MICVETFENVFVFAFFNRNKKQAYNTDRLLKGVLRMARGVSARFIGRAELTIQRIGENNSNKYVKVYSHDGC